MNYVGHLVCNVPVNKTNLKCKMNNNTNGCGGGGRGGGGGGGES